MEKNNNKIVIIMLVLMCLFNFKLHKVNAVDYSDYVDFVIKPATSEIRVGQEMQLEIESTGQFNCNQNDSGYSLSYGLAEYSSSNDAVATVSKYELQGNELKKWGGLVKGISEGTVTITVKWCTVTKTKEIRVTSGSTPEQPTTDTYNFNISPTSATIKIGDTRQISITPVGTAQCNSSVTYSSSAESIATVSSTGLVKGLTAGNATITITQCGVSKNASITVNEDGQGEEPEQPDEPSNPDNPVDPGNPDNPDNPVDPVNPSNPGNPSNPDNPQTGTFGQLLLLLLIPVTLCLGYMGYKRMHANDV